MAVSYTHLDVYKRQIWDGPAEANTGTPGLVGGRAAERVLRAPVAGVAAWTKEIGDRVREGEIIGDAVSYTHLGPY